MPILKLLRRTLRPSTSVASTRQWCGSKGLLQGAVDKAKADDQRHAGERQHHHLQVRKAVDGKQRKIVQDMLPKTFPVTSRREPVEGSAVCTHLCRSHVAFGRRERRAAIEIAWENNGRNRSGQI